MKQFPGANKLFTKDLIVDYQAFAQGYGKKTLER